MAAKRMAPDYGILPSCEALGVPRASYYRSLAPRPRKPRPKPPRALSDEERQAVLAVCHSEAFGDRAPAEIQATLLDQGTYLCSVRTMYRILDDAKEIKERRAITRHPAYVKPELCATAPNQVWSWDITDLKGPVKGSRFKLYVCIDIFSRLVVGWVLARREDANLAADFLEVALDRHGVTRGSLTIHADNGPAMISQPVGQLMETLGVTKSHSRPHVSDDNAFSEAHFKTLKYHPGFPERFGGIEDAHAFCQAFFEWYNQDHRHSGIGMMTPADVHAGQSDKINRQRQLTLADAFAAHPERFPKGLPRPLALPAQSWINPPKERAA
jgi:putative transposase